MDLLTDGGRKKTPLPKICHRYPTMMKPGILYLTQGRSKKYMNHVTHPLSSAGISIFSTALCCVKMYISFWYKISNFFNFFESLKMVLVTIDTILMMLRKMPRLGLLKMRLFWNNCYDVIISVYDIINKILLNASNYILGVVMWPKFGSSSISMTEVIITSIL